MMELLKCILYLLTIGFAIFLAGRIAPKGWFDFDSFPYRITSHEKESVLYKKFKVAKWKDKLPDMCRILPHIMPSKKVGSRLDTERTEFLLRETCIAEWSHLFLAILGFGCVRIMKGVGGIWISVLYALGNLPFNIVQRFNRIRLLKVYEKLKEKEDRLQLREDLELKTT